MKSIKMEKKLAFSLVVTVLLLLSFLPNKNFLIGFTFILQLFTILLNYKKKKNVMNNIGSKSYILPYIVICFVLSILIAFLGGNFERKIGATILVFAQIIMVYLICNTTNDKKNLVKEFCLLFVNISVVFAIYSILVFTLGNKFQSFNPSLGIYTQNLDLFGIRFVQSSIGGDVLGTYNVGSIFSNPNSMSYCCLISLIFILSNYYCGEKKHFIFKSGILIYGLIISGSRLAILSSLIIVPLFVCYSFLTKKAINRVLFFYVLIIFIGVILYNYQYLLSSINFNGRLENWIIGMKNVGVIGSGINSDNLLIEKYTSTTASMHNAYISFLVNFGIIPFIVFIVFLIQIINKSIKETSISENRLFFVITVIFIIISLAEYTFFSFSAYNLIFFFMIFSMLEMNKKESIKS